MVKLWTFRLDSLGWFDCDQDDAESDTYVLASDYAALAAELDTLAEFLCTNGLRKDGHGACLGLVRRTSDHTICDAEIRRLRDALIRLHMECMEAGHGSDKDYGWPLAMKRAQEAIASTLIGGTEPCAHDLAWRRYDSNGRPWCEKCGSTSAAGAEPKA